MKTEIKATAKVEFTVQLILTESEARAFEAMIGYGVDAFLKVFYEHLGKSYMQPHEAGLKSMFNNRTPLSSQLSKITEAKAVLSEMNKILPFNQE